MAQSFDVSALATWKDERKGEIILKPLELDSSMNYFDKVTGVAGNNVLLPTFDDSGVIAAGACGFSPAGGETVVKQVSITAPAFKVEREWCLVDLMKYFTKQYLPEKESPDTFDILDEVVGRSVMQATRRMAIINWLGDPAVGAYPTDYKARQGVLAQLTGLIPAGQQHTLGSGVTITTANAITVFDSVVKDLPSATLAGGAPVLFCGTDVFVPLMMALRAANYFHYQYDVAADTQAFTLKPIVYPGTNVLIVPTVGLNSNNDSNQPVATAKQRIIATYQGNIIFGFDASMDEFDVWYSKDFNSVRMRYAFHAGVAVKFPDLISEFHLTP